MADPDRVATVTVRRVRVPLAEPFATSRGSVDVLQVSEIVLTDGAGRTGTGWAVPATRLTGQTPESVEAALGQLRDVLEGAVGGAPAVLLRALAERIPANPAAKAAADLAVHALACAQAGLSLPVLLGAGPTPAVATDVTIGLDTPDRVAAAVRRRVAQGFSALKIKVGGLPDDDVARVLAARSAGEHRVRLRLDANQGWTPGAAVRVLDRLHASEVELEFVEQPVAAADLRGMAWVRARCGYPVMADESVTTPEDVLRVAEAEAADLVNVKLAKHGGLRGATRVVAVAEAVHLPCMVGSMLEAPGSVAASVAFAATLPWTPPHDLDAGLWLRGTAAPLVYDPPWVRVDPPPRQAMA